MTRIRLALVAAISLSLAACGKDEAPSDVLAYVPADTPYVMANQKAMPDEVLRAWLGMYGDSVSQMYVDMADSPAMKEIEGELGLWLRAAMPEMAQLIGPDASAKTGISFAKRYAIYGVDLLPVYRIEIEDPAKLDAMFKRIEERAGKPLPVKAVGELSLKHFGNDKAQVLFGAVGPHFVVTMAPANADAARLERLLGITLPETSIADSGALSALDNKMSYDGQFSGYIDIVDLVKRLSGQNAADSALIAAFGGEAPNLSATCQQELLSIAQTMPRAVFGAREFTANRMDFNTVIEMDPVKAKAMLPITAPIPGGANDESVLLRVALSANVPEAVKYLGTIADAINAAPYACEDLKGLNDAALELKSNLANPGLAMAGSVTALHFGLTQLEMEKGAEMPSALSGFVAIGSPTPLLLWGLAQQSLPPLAKVTLAADGNIVALPDDTVPAPIPLQLKALMNDKVLAMATADVADASLTALSAPATSDGTVFRYSVGGKFFSVFEAIMPEAPPEASEQEAKAIAQSKAMFKAFGERVEILDVRMQVTERGIEFNQIGVLK